MNDENLINLAKRVQREKLKIQSKGGKAKSRKTKTRKKVNEVIKDVLYSNIKLPELKKMVDKMNVYDSDAEKNNLLALVISVFIKGVKKGDSRILKDLIELSEGKLTEKIEITLQDKTVLEIQDYLKLKKKRKNE